MKIRTRTRGKAFPPVFVLCAAISAAGLAAALNAAPAPPPLLAAPVSVAQEDAIKADIQALVEKVNAKLASGRQSESELAPELGEFDALMAKYAGLRSETVGMIGVMKANLYLEVFQDEEKAVALLKEVRSAFPGTELAAKIDEFIEQLAARARAEAITEVGKTFAPFSEKDITGAPLELAAYRGKIVLVDFWATWCGPCVRDLPDLMAIYEKYHARGFEVIGVSLDKDLDALRAFVGKHKLPWPQYFDGQVWEGRMAVAYGVSALPTTILLDGEGKIVSKRLHGDELSEKVAELLDARK